MSSQINPAVVKSLNTAILFFRIFGVIAILTILFSGITFIQPDEVGIILRFGKIVGETPAEQIKQPGLLFAYPYLIDDVVRVPVKRVHSVNIDSLHSTRLGDITVLGYGYAITGDDNFIIINAEVNYNIIDPIKYALEFEEPAKIIEEITTGVMTQTIASLPVDYILIEGRDDISNTVYQLVQERLDHIDLGVQITAVKFPSIQPPREVSRDFEAVTSSYVERETRIREAQSYQESVIPQAQAIKQQTIGKAEAFRANRLATARADVAQFYGVLEEYQNYPFIVHQQLFYERIQSIMRNIGSNIIFPSDGTERRIILPSSASWVRGGF